MSEEKKKTVELDDQALDKVAGGSGGYGYDDDPRISDSCIGCFACMDTCPVDAIIDAGGMAQIDLTRCIRCGGCVGVCPVGAIDVP